MAGENLGEMMQRLEDLEKRLKVAEDIEQIKSLQRRHMNAHSSVKPEEETACFTDNATLDLPNGLLKGKAAILEINNRVAEIEGPQARKNPTKAAFIVHPLIVVDGDKATGNWVQYEMEAHPRTHQSLFWAQSTYDAAYVRENGEWKISYLKWRVHGAPPGEPPEPIK
jgi:hypothetical protein